METSTTVPVAERPKLRVRWYRSPVSRENLKQLNQRSDLKGFLQAGGHLGLLALNGTAAVWSAYHWPWYVTAAILLFHGTCWHFLINGFHELVHDSVFKTRWLNGAFLRVFSFLGWYNHQWFWASHMEHHKYTLHQPDDLEVVLPEQPTLWSFLRSAVFSPIKFWYTMRNTVTTALGVVTGEWGLHLFPKSEPAKRRELFNWARILLLGHGLIMGVSIYMHWWMLPVVTSLAPFYGGALHFFCNASQHIGLVDKTPDYRLCCRTFYLNPFVQFLYWNMNYHTEHHMYAAVPCYNLPRLHRVIKHDMPECQNGLAATWFQIIGILWRQKIEPGYQYAAPLPTPSRQPQQAPSAPPDESPEEHEASDHHYHHQH